MENIFERKKLKIYEEAPKSTYIYNNEFNLQLCVFFFN